MNGRRLNLSLMIALVLLCGLTLVVRQNLERPNFEFFPDMYRSVASKSFAANLVFSDARTLQQPVAGTIPRQHRSLGYGPSEEDAIRAGEELANPFASDNRRETRRGAELYQSFCSHCHGGGGNGDGAVGLHGFPAPPSLLATEAKDLPDGQIFHIITFGQKNMPPHAIQIEPEDRWRIVLHVRSQQQQSEEEMLSPTLPLEEAIEQ